MNFRILFGICFGGPGGIFESHGGKMMEDEVPPRTGYRGIAVSRDNFDSSCKVKRRSN